MAQISLNTALKELDIVMNGEKVGTIHFDPNDFSIISRMREVYENADSKYSKAIESLKTESTDEENIGSFFDKLDAIDKDIRESINYIFGYDVSSIVFGNTYTFTSQKNGEPIAAQFMQSVMKYIEAEITKAAKASEKRTAKYTAKYQNGK